MDRTKSNEMNNTDVRVRNKKKKVIKTGAFYCCAIGINYNIYRRYTGVVAMTLASTRLYMVSRCDRP